MPLVAILGCAVLVQVVGVAAVRWAVRAWRAAQESGAGSGSDAGGEA